MTVPVIYDSQFGNTERIARAIAGSLGPAQVVRAQKAGTLDLTACELLVVGGPTQWHDVSPALRELFERMPRGALAHVPAAAFDTRYQMTAFLTGSAASWIAGPLRRGGAHLVPPRKASLSSVTCLPRDKSAVTSWRPWSQARRSVRLSGG